MWGEVLMAKQDYIATIMDKYYLGDDNYFYMHSYTTEGTYDPESEIFRDKNGLEFLPATNINVLRSEINRGYLNLTKKEELPKLMGKKTLSEAIPEFDYRCSRYIFYVSTTENELVFCLPIDYQKMKESLQEDLSLIEEHGGLEHVAVDKVKIPVSHVSGAVHIDAADYVAPYQSAIFQREEPREILDFLKEVWKGNYTAEQLKEIRDVVEARRDNIQSLVESLNSRIDGEQPTTVDPNTKEEQPVDRKKKFVKIDSAGKEWIDMEGIYQKMLKTLIAQDAPARRVLVEIARKLRSAKSNERGLLITGQTGSGKTKLMELVARYIDHPFLKIDSTQLTVAGYVGKDIEEELWKLYVACEKDINRTEKAIIFFDEIDKKGTGSKGDVNGKGVLNELLPFFDGTTYDACADVKHKKDPVQINTKNMLIVLGGAFEDVYKDLNRQELGFTSDDEKAKRKKKAAQPKDFVEKAQMPNEFMGRVDVIKLNDLEVEDIRRILLESDESSLLNQQKLFQELGVRLTPGDDFVTEIARRGVEKKTGCRGIDSVINEATWAAYDDAYTHPGEIEEIILQKETIDNPMQYQKVMKKRDSK